MSTAVGDLGSGRPAQSAASAGAWTLPEVEATGKSAITRTGPSGLMLGTANKQHVHLRLFRPQGTRLFLATPDYATWLVAFRAMCLGAHLSIVSGDPKRWRALAEAMSRVGGTVELLGPGEKVPGQGRPYRPSLVLSDTGNASGVSAGPWQAIATTENISAGSAVHALRNCDLALFGTIDARAQENVRRAYVLTQAQMRLASNLGQSDVVMAMPRRLSRLSMPPGQQEYRLLFN